MLFLVRKTFTPVLLGFLVLRSETLNPFESTWNEELILRKAVILSIYLDREENRVCCCTSFAHAKTM